MAPLDDLVHQFQHVFNFRDLGGRVTVSGRTVRPGVLFRSASLTDANQSDMDLLATQLGIRSLIDLRNPVEQHQFGVIKNWPGSVMHLALFEDTDLLHLFPTLGDGYVDFLKRSHIGKRLVEVLSLIAAEGTLPAVIFCGAGKDRTGLVASAILGLLGVPDEDIADDYTRSAMPWRCSTPFGQRTQPRRLNRLEKRTRMLWEPRVKRWSRC